MAESSLKYSLLSSRDRLFTEQSRITTTTGHSAAKPDITIPTKPDITMPTAPLAVWVIRTIGLTNLITETEKALDIHDQETVKNLKLNKDSLEMAEIEWHVYGIIIEAVTKLTSTYLNDEAVGSRVARVLAGLLVPKFLAHQKS